MTKKKYKLMFYDAEVLSKSICPETGESWWGFIFRDYDTRKGKMICNNRQELIDFYNATKDDYIFVGYNCNYYDQWILKGLILGYDAGFVSDSLILHNRKGYEVIRNGYKVQLYSFDCTTGFHSLKQLEGFMGSRIEESNVSFEIDRPITHEEMMELMRYCNHDVNETIKVFEARRDDFDSQMGLLEMFNLDISKISKTKTQLVAEILGAKKRDYTGDEFDFIYADTIQLGKYQYLKDWFDSIKDNHKNMDKIEHTSLIGGISTTVALGGCHGSIDGIEVEGIIVSADVALNYIGATKTL